MKYIYATSRSGLEVRIPEDRFEEWQKAQEAMSQEQVEADKAAIARFKAKLANK